MADDPEQDIYPSKEINPSITSEIHVSERLNQNERRSAPHLSRSDLEDQFYRFKEENYQLKKAAKKQEENLKKLATKMSRLLREKKSLEAMNSPSHKRDLELEEMVEDLQDKVRTLEKANSHLREKMLVAKQQVIMQVRKPYSHIGPKVNSGNAIRSLSAPYASSISLRGKNIQSYLKKVGTTPIPPYAVNLLEEARNELSNLKMLISSQKTEIEQYEHENEVLKQKLRMREIEFEDELNALKSQLTQRQRQHVQENLDLIRLHRELKQKNANYLALQTQCNDMEEKMKMLKLKHDHIVKEMDDLSARFKTEQKKNIELLGELQKAQMSLSAVSELQGKITVLQKENTFLRETNEKFIKNALDIENQRIASLEDGKRLQMEEMFKEKISNLESSLEIQNKEKYAIQEKLLKEKEARSSMEKAYDELKEKFEQTESLIADLKAKVDVIKSYDMEIDDLEDAASLLKLKKENKLNLTAKIVEVPETPAVAEPVKEVTPEMIAESDLKISLEELEELKSQLKKIKDEHAEALKELSNVRELLMAQYKVNEASQSEITLLTEKIKNQEKEFQAKLNEHVHLLDLRNARIEILEKQLNDIAYGTQTYQSTLPNASESGLQSVELSKGENIFEIHIVKIDLTSEGLKQFYSSNPNVFLTWNFYEFELQSTPVMSARKPFFNYTAQYTVQVDDYFLCYLLEKTITLELHESLGVNFKTFASGKLNFSDIFSESCTRIHGNQELIGTEEYHNVNFGTVEYWMHLQIPMNEAFKYFKEKLKALKYIHSNKEKSAVPVSFFEQPINRDIFMNELHIKIIQGMNLKSRQKDVLPSSFCVYKFFDLPDQDTAIVPACDNPVFSDHRTFSLFINANIVKYLKTEDLYVYVFDDNELDITSHIGRAAISLHPLLDNKPVKGIFELEKNGKTGYGCIEVLIYWQYEFIAASIDSSMQNETSEPKKFMVTSPHHSTSSSSEDEALYPPYSANVSLVQPPVPKPRKSIASGPVTSTPIPKKSSSSSSEADSSSHEATPVHTRKNHFTPVKESVKNSNTSTGAGNELKVTAEIHSPAENSSLQNKPQVSQVKRASFSSDVSEENKPAFSDESEESEVETNSDSSEKQKEYKMALCVHSLMLRDDATVLQDDTVKMLYVEFRFLDYPLEELETPFSLPKVASPNIIQYNFEKVFTFKSSDIEKWNLLAKMIFSDTPESSLINFIIVSEPPSDEQDLDCEEIGYGSVDLREILLNQEDKIQEEITIYDASDNTMEIGQLKISIKALEILEKLKEIVES